MSDNNDMSMQVGRHVHWSLTAIFSTVALCALVTEWTGKVSDQERDTKWAVSAISINLALSWVSVMANMFLSSNFVGTMMEGGLAMLTCMLCAAVLPALMDPNNELTVTDYNGGIMNANLYFSSWGAFIWSFLVLTGFMKEKFGVTKTFSPTSWGALCMTSIIAMVSGARLFHNLDCNNVDENMDDLEKMCNRTSLAVGLGAVVGLISAVWMLLGLFTTGFLNDIMELGLSTLSMALWTFGVGYVTFGDNAPATAVGNLYFFTWGSFAISVMILVTSLNMFKSKRTAGESGGDVEAGHGQTDDKKEKADENVRETEDEA